MEIIKTDVAIVGAGGTGLRAAIAVAEQDPTTKIALISKVYPMRSHTVAAEGGAAGVIGEDDTLEKHFEDTVAGGDWLCEQDVVDYFVAHTTEELFQLEHWGCPWSRKPDGRVNVRRFGGMKVPRTWFAADKSGFHMLHTLFQTSIKYPSIQRFDEHFVLDLLEEDGQIKGVVTYDIQNGVCRTIIAKSVILATGGAGRAYSFNTNGGIVTGDGMALAYRHGVPLRDMEFVQYHPTGLLGCGVLMTEGCRGEGGILVNKDGYRYLQDYGLGPETPVGQPKNKYMELGPRDRVSQAFWNEQKKGRTIKTPLGDAVHLDLRHLGRDYLHERLPLICELAMAYAGVDPAESPVPIRPVVHYTMGGIETDGKTATRKPGLYAAGECASVGIHGANRLGSNSLVETIVFGRLPVSKPQTTQRPFSLVTKQTSQSRLKKLFSRQPDCLKTAPAPKAVQRFVMKWATQWKKVLVSTVKKNQCRRPLTHSKLFRSVTRTSRSRILQAAYSTLNSLTQLNLVTLLMLPNVWQTQLSTVRNHAVLTSVLTVRTVHTRSVTT